MQTIKLYKYERAEGGVTISPTKPNAEYTEMLRLVADEGKALTMDRKEFTPCVDVESIEGWYEITEEEYAEILKAEEEALESLG